MYITLLPQRALPQLFPYLPICEKKAQVLFSLGQKEVQIIQALTYMWNSPALSPFTTIKVKPVSFLCSLKPIMSLLETLFCSPQKNSLCEWWIFSCSLEVCVISLNIPTKFWLKDPSCLCGVMTAISLKIRILRCSPLLPGVFSLFFGFWTGSAICWWTGTVNYCTLASLCFDLASFWCIWERLLSLTNIYQFSQPASPASPALACAFTSILQNAPAAVTYAS